MNDYDVITGKYQGEVVASNILGEPRPRAERSRQVLLCGVIFGHNASRSPHHSALYRIFRNATGCKGRKL